LEHSSARNPSDIKTGAKFPYKFTLQLEGRFYGTTTPHENGIGISKFGASVVSPSIKWAQYSKRALSYIDDFLPPNHHVDARINKIAHSALESGNANCLVDV